MQVFLIRHADAVDPSATLRDEHRYLTPHGRDQARALGDRLRWHDCGPSQVWCSPLVRAMQTAELALSRIDTNVDVHTQPLLVPDAPAHAVVAALATLAPDAEIFLVGHEPSLSAIAALLTGGDEVGPVAKAEAIRVDDGRVRWRFAWDAEAPATRSA